MTSSTSSVPGPGLASSSTTSFVGSTLRPLSRLLSPSLSALRAEINADQLRAKWPYLAALGAGCLVGAGGVFLAQRLSRRIAAHQYHQGGEASLSKELTSLHVTVRDLSEAVRELKEQQQKQGGRGRGTKVKSALRTVTFSDVEQSFFDRRNLDEDEDDGPPLSNGGTATGSTTTGTSEFFSCVSGDDDEFFDIPSDDEGGDGDDGAAKPSAVSDQILELFRAVDDLMEGSGGEQQKALRLLRTKEDDLGQNSEYLWRLCKAIYLSSVAQSPAGANREHLADDAACANAKKALVEEAVEYGKRAVEANELSSEAHKWYAIAVGSRGEFVGIRDKILDGFEFKRHVDRAAELAPADHTVRHLLGRFCFEVAELSWWERRMAGALFAEPPTASMEEARDHFLAAERIKPEGWKENRLFAARAMIKLGEEAEAAEWLEKARDMPIRNPDDQQAHDEIEVLLCQRGVLSTPS